jgi:hypothetical protein
MRHRTPGVHVSGVITYLCRSLGIFKGDGLNNQAWMELGSALEHAIKERMIADDRARGTKRYVDPGEITKDGLIGSPDLLDIDDWAIEEIKLSWMSSNQDPEGDKFWRYWVQLMAYCYMAETTLGRLRVCHVNGNYRWDDDPGPDYRIYERRFDEQELAENWYMLCTHGKRIGPTE